MRKWHCVVCNGEDVTIMFDFKNRIVIKCESCKDSQWINRG